MVHVRGPLFLSPSILTVLALSVLAGCQGGAANQLVSLESIDPGDDCANGGFEILVGTDENDDGVLDSDEVDSSEILCNGEDGEIGDPGDDGDDGMNALVDTTELLRGDEDCPRGGFRVDVGLDNGDGGGTAGDGILQEGEIDDTDFVCDVAPSFDISALDPPTGAVGTATIDLSGGNATDGVAGSGGKLWIGNSSGLDGGHVKAFHTGSVDATLPAPAWTTWLGTNPLEVTQNTTIPRIAYSGADGIPDPLPDDDSVYFLNTQDWPWGKRIYTWDDAAGVSVEVTGLHVHAGITLTLPRNDSGAGTLVFFDQDVLNEGTITIDKPNPAKAEGGGDDNAYLNLNCTTYHGASGSKLDLDGAEPLGYGYTLYLNARSVFNEGTLSAIGLERDAAAPAYAGGGLFVYGDEGVYNTGPIDIHGGSNASLGAGGDGGEGILSSQDGFVFNEGPINVMGGKGAAGGGPGGSILLETDRGDLRNTGAIDVSGGDSENCDGPCPGGDGGIVEFHAGGGRILNAGTIAANGGHTSGDASGTGGTIEFRSRDDWASAGSIEVSGSLTARGGSGGADGYGGLVHAWVDASGLTPAEITFYGYEKFILEGGSVDVNAPGGLGGIGGDVLIENGCPGSDAAAAGGAANFVEVSVRGGDSPIQWGGRGGTVSVLACNDADEGGQHWGGSMALNAGGLVITGGSGGTGSWGGNGGSLQITGWDWAENRGAVDVSGADGEVARVFGSSSGGAGGWVQILSSMGMAVNSGGITGRGGDITDADGNGAHAGDFTLRGSLADNSGIIVLSGGAGGGTTGFGGSGGDVVVSSMDGTSVNTGTFDIGYGMGGTLNGDYGTVVVDGNNETSDWVP